jgi:outer membrane immunogenic protein
MKAILGLSLVAAASVAAHGALAADLPRLPYKAPAYVDVPLFNWTSFYIGLHAGYGFGK